MVKGFFVTKSSVEYNYFIRAFGFNPSEWPLLSSIDKLRGYHPYPLIWTLGNWTENRANYDLIEEADKLGAQIVSPQSVRERLNVKLPADEDIAKAIADISEEALSDG